jgi:hypothetical protein
MVPVLVVCKRKALPRRECPERRFNGPSHFLRHRSEKCPPRPDDNLGEDSRVANSDEALHAAAPASLSGFEPLALAETRRPRRPPEAFSWL